MKGLQEIILQWAVGCFGSIASRKNERLRRFFEEACEIAQAGYLSQDDCYKIVDYVYGREVGEMPQEIGGCAVTMLALCQVYGYDLSN
jgi:hypothetical protein